MDQCDVLEDVQKLLVPLKDAISESRRITISLGQKC